MSFQVRSEVPWQGTGLFINAGDRLNVEYVDGFWWDVPVIVGYDANGDPDRPDSPNYYPMPGLPNGCLIGKCGPAGAAFFVGNTLTNFAPPNTGQLFLCMNDVLTPGPGEGPGFSDNSGTISVDLSVDVPPGPGKWSVGGQLLSGLVGGLRLGRQADGRLVLLGKNLDRGLSSISQTAATDWGQAWSSQGGAINATPIAVATNADGRIEVCVQGLDGALWHIFQTAANGPWSDWGSLGGVILGGPRMILNGQGLLDVFACGNNGALWHIREVPGGWGEWSSLGGQILEGPFVNPAFTVGRNTDGRLEAFVRGIDAALWHSSEAVPGGPWSKWFSLGGQVTDLLDVAMNGSGQLEVFAQGLNGAVWRIQQSEAPDWGQAWRSLGGAVKEAMRVGRNADGRLEVFATGMDDGLWHTWQLSPGTSRAALKRTIGVEPAVPLENWSQWVSMGGRMADLLDVASNADGRLEVFFLSQDGTSKHLWQVAPSNGWAAP